MEPEVSWLAGAADVVGAAGGLLIVAVYFLLQVERIDARGFVYSSLNALGAALILVSLRFDFNLGAMLVEAFWLLVSVLGIGKWVRARRRGAGGSSEAGVGGAGPGDG